MWSLARSTLLMFALAFVCSQAAMTGWATMWATTNQDLIGSSCEYANAPVNSITDPVLASYLRTGHHCAIGIEYGIGDPCGKCYRLTSTSDSGRHGTPGSVGSAVVMVSNSGAGGSNHFDCILSSFQEVTGATTGVFDITYEQTECMDVSGVPTIINWADQNAWYCKMMFENVGGWGSLQSVHACLDDGECKFLQRFSGQTWTGCPLGIGTAMTFTLTQQSPSGHMSSIVCTCSVGTWPWPTGTRCECPSNFVTSGSSSTTRTSAGPTATTMTTTTTDSMLASTSTSTSTSARRSCTPMGQDCRATKCCSDRDLACYEKNQWWAECRTSCTPGIDHTDAPEYRTPWSCAVVGMSTTTTTAGPHSCTPTGQNCLTTRCCGDPGLSCYEKNQWWATCKASCTPGIDHTDAPQYQTPWSCVVLDTMSTVTATTTPRSCAPTGQDCRTSKCCGEPGLSCYEKNQWWATCKASCTPGIDHTEAPEYQTPWGCAVLSGMATATTTTTVGSNSCTPAGQNCRTSTCCNDPSFACYEKNQWWATCKASCSPGVDHTEIPEYQTPWTCVALNNTRRLRLLV